jgi:hypothetical protein
VFWKLILVWNQSGNLKTVLNTDRKKGDKERRRKKIFAPSKQVCRRSEKSRNRMIKDTNKL